MTILAFSNAERRAIFKKLAKSFFDEEPDPSAIAPSCWLSNPRSQLQALCLCMLPAPRTPLNRAYSLQPIGCYSLYILPTRNKLTITEIIEHVAYLYRSRFEIDVMAKF